MDLGIVYAIVAFSCVLMDLIILNRTRSTAYKETIDRDFCSMLDFFIGFSLTDGVWGLFMSRTLGRNALGFEIFTYGFHGMSALSAFMWSGYMVKYTRAEEKEDYFLTAIRYSLLLIQFYVFISNFWNHAAFVVTKEAVYIPGTMRTVMFILQFTYYVILILYAAWKLLGKRRDARLYRTALIFCAIPVVFGLAQLAFPDAAMYSLGFTFIAVCIFSFNVTQQREKYLASSFEKEKSKLTSIAAGLAGDFQAIYYVDLDTDEYEDFSNNAGVQNQGLSGSQTKGNFFASYLRDTERMIYPADREMVRLRLSKENMLAELSDKQAYSFGFRLLRDNAPVYYMVKVIRPTGMDGENRAIVGVFDDDARIRGEMEQQVQLEEARNHAEAANKAKSAFLFNMSHDIRTPMNAIIGFTNIAQKHIDEPEQLQECLGKIEAASNHLLQLINDVLDMASIEAGKMEVNEEQTNIRKNAESITTIIQETANRKHISFQYEFRNIRDEEVFSDAFHLNQIMMNILSNAIKYTPEGGHVLYTVEQLPDQEADIGSYRFTVKDNGVGMSLAFVQHVFEEFSRENTSTVSGVEGTGLGMSIVKRLTEQMGGTISVESSPGVGTTVTVGFRFRKAPHDGDTVEPECVRETERIDFAGKRVLLVEDNELNREIARDALEELGLLIEEAEDGSVALELVQGHEPTYYDLVLMDIQMPCMDGYQATREIRRLENGAYRELAVVAMTANAFDEDRRNALEAGMNDHLSKPIDMVQLQAALRKFLMP